MIKNVLFSDAENDVLKGITGDNYYVFEGEYGNDTVKTKGNKNTLQFDGGTEYYFTAQGNNLVMHTETNATEIEEEFYYNGEFTNEAYREVDNISVKDLYVDDNGQISETGTDTQRIGDKTLLKMPDNKYVAVDSDMYYNPVTKEFTTEAIRIAAPEGTVKLSDCYITTDGYLSTQSGELIGDRPVYCNTSISFGESNNFYVRDGLTGVEILGFYLDSNPSYYYLLENPQSIFIKWPTSSYDENIYFYDKGIELNNTPITELDNLVKEQYYLNNAFTDKSTHLDKNKSISELYLVDGEIKESGNPEQLIGNQTLYEFDGKYYITAENGNGTVTITNFLKGKIDVNVDIGNIEGSNLADMVNDSYILYDKSDATKKQTIKAHTNWNDKVIGSDFNDKIYGGNYNDKLYGGAGNDVIYTRTGDDEVYGEDGNDKIYLNGKGTKVVDAGSGDDKIYLTAKNITADITAGEGNDRIYIKKSVLEDSVLNFKEGSGNDIVAVSKKVDVSNLTLNIENFNADTSKFSKSGNNLKITSGNDSVTLTNYFVKGYNVSSALLEDKTLAEWVENSELYITSNSKTTKGTVYDDVITVGSKVKSVSSYDGNDVICSSYQKMTVDGGEGTDIYNFQTDKLEDYTVLFNIKKDAGETEDSSVGNALYVVSNDSKKLSNGVTLKNVEKVQVNGSDYALTDEIIQNVQSWLNESSYDSVADAISHKCNVQELIAAFNPQVTSQEQIV